MSAIANFIGFSRKNGFGSKRPARCSNFTDANLFWPLARNVDGYCPARKMPRLAAPLSFWEEEQFCTIDAIPDECLFEILRRLPERKDKSVAACVSKRWLMLLSSIRVSETLIGGTGELSNSINQLPADGELEEAETDNDGYLTRSLNGVKATDVRLAAIAIGTAGCGGLGELNIHGTHRTRGVTDVGLSAVARGCPYLRALSLWDIPLITDAGLVEIANGCSKMEKIDIFKCPLITDESLIAVARNCPNLTSVELKNCSRIGNECLEALGQCCRMLEFVSIKDCALVSDQGVTGLVSQATASLARLKLQGVDITNASLASIGQKGKNIADLILSGLRRVNESGFWLMGRASGLQSLKSLSIISCNGVMAEVLKAIATGSPSLKQLSLRRCRHLSDAGVGNVALVARALETLHLEECNHITFDGILGFLLYCDVRFKSLELVKCSRVRDTNHLPPPLPLCPSLRSLTVSDCPGFAGSSLAIVAMLCPYIEEIDLSGLVRVTDAGLLPLLQITGPRLIHVNLSGCVNLTDAAICALVTAHGETLQFLNINGCVNITDRSLIAIAVNCSVLDDLDMSSCSITDYGVAALASASQINMRILSLWGCSRLTDISLLFLRNFGGSLEGLNLQHCNLISAQGASALDEQLWRCDILF